MEITATCCNCRKPFCINGFGSPIKGSLPYILQCGHSVCETCIFLTIKSFHNVKCQQCQSITNLSNEEMIMVNEFPENFKKFIPPNFYILGCLTYNNFRMGSTKQTGLENPRLQYTQYNSPFTQDCQRKIPPNRDLKSPTFCSEHIRKVCELYCLECCKAICTVCLVKVCGKHEFSLLTDKNDQFMNDIKVHKNMTEKIILLLKKTAGELEKKRSQIPLRSMDTKPMEAMLTKHFDRFRGILQRMENSLVMEINYNKNYLNEMIKGLHDSAKDLSDFINAVDYFTESEKLKELNLHKVAEELKRTANTPWFLEEDVKSIEPTIKLKIDEDVFKELENHCQIESNILKFKLLSTTELPTNIEYPPVLDAVACETASAKSTVYPDTKDGGEVCMNHELIQNDLAVSTRQPGLHVSNMKTDKDVKVNLSGTKLEVKILTALTPSDIYISINFEEEGLHKLYKEMQIFYAHSGPDNSIVWKQGNKCAVLPNNKVWSRAIVKSVDKNSKTVEVFLKDHASLIEANENNLRLLEPNFMKVRDGAWKCHLSGIIPASGDKWLAVTCERLRHIFLLYDQFYITEEGEISDDESMPIELWVYHTTPTIKEWRSINNMILEDGLAVPERIFKPTPSPVEAPSTSSAIPQQLEVVSLDSTLHTLNLHSAPITYEDWLPAQPLRSKEFIAIGTHVEEDLSIYLYDKEQSSSTLELLSGTLTSHFANSVPKLHDMLWAPGQICITKFDSDEKYYRAKVLSIAKHLTRAEVLFVDYGNKQDCPVSSLRKDVVCHHIPIQAQVCKLYNIKPVKGDVWEYKIADFVHRNIVEKECQVTVMGEAINGVIPVALKVEQLHDLSELLIFFKYAVPHDTRN